jgi:uncharacterized protein YbjT (DUF2867 family)
MRIVVVGANGLVGSKLVRELSERGHDAVAASLETGVDTLTGQGLAAALAGASVVVDVSGAASLLDADTATRNLLAVEAAAGVGHHVALSVVGTPDELIAKSSIPYSIVCATDCAADDVAGALAEISLHPPLNGTCDVAGPDRTRLTP